MQRFLIATAANDIHAVVVAHALRHLGFDCFRWLTSDYPIAQECSISIDPDGHGLIKSADGTFELDYSRGDYVFWNRRVVSEHRVPQELCSSDAQVSAREARSFMQSFVGLLETAAFCVNKIYAAKRAENKALQLLLAVKSGFQVPRSLITNDLGFLRKFIASTPGRILAKPFSPTVWKSSEGDHVTRSGLLDPTLSLDGVSVQACPMIFQPYVEKDFEVRITCFGKKLVGVRLDSQSLEISRIDWRAVSPARLGVTRIEIPTHVELACRQLLTSLDLEFGCIDLIVTTRGEWIFLEINQMGQFLWIEDVNADLPMLDLFVQLLTRANSEQSEERVYGLKYKDYVQPAVSVLRDEQPLRVPKIEVNVVDEPIL